MRDLKNARSNGDTAKALDVLQMCTRKNVGGVMSNELFAFTNSGEPKFIVKEVRNCKEQIDEPECVKCK